MHSACSSSDEAQVTEACQRVSEDTWAPPHLELARQAELEAGYASAEYILPQNDVGTYADFSEVDAGGASAASDQGAQRIRNWLQNQSGGGSSSPGIGLLGFQQLRPIRRSAPPSSGSSRRSVALVTIPSGVELENLAQAGGSHADDVEEEEVICML